MVVFAFSDAVFHGSTADLTLTHLIVDTAVFL